MPMVKRSGKTTAKKAYKKVLAQELPYAWDWTDYADTDTLVEMNDQMTLEEQLKVRNRERENKARQASLKTALEAAGIVPDTAANNPQIAMHAMLKNLMFAKDENGAPLYTLAQAREVVSTAYRQPWADAVDVDPEADDDTPAE